MLFLLYTDSRIAVNTITMILAYYYQTLEMCNFYSTSVENNYIGVQNKRSLKIIVTLLQRSAAALNVSVDQSVSLGDGGTRRSHSSDKTVRRVEEVDRTASICDESRPQT